MSTPSESTVRLASTSNPLAIPVSTSVIANTRPVPTAAMANRLRRHCRSRSAALSTSDISA
jgi:hypothetical protein